MKKSLIAAVVLAGASFGPSAVMAQTVVGNSPQALDWTDLSAYFGDVFAADNAGNTFADRFTFTVEGTIGYNLDAIVASISRSADVGLDVTGLALYGVDDVLISDGTSVATGVYDLWTLSSNNLAAGDYYVQVSGDLVSDTAASFGGAIMLAPVPEPQTWGMLLGGLGVVGWLARRRQKQQV